MKDRFLTKEQFRQNIRKYRNGDRAARDEILETNRLFVITMARKYVNLWNNQYDQKMISKIEIGDLTQAGYVGLMKAIDDFDLRRDMSFLTYAYWWVFAHMQSVLKSNLAVGTRSGDSIKAKFVNPMEKAALMPSKNNGGSENPDIIRFLSQHLSREDCQLICAKFGIGCKAQSFVNIAKKSGVSMYVVRDRFHAAMDKLRELAI